MYRLYAYKNAFTPISDLFSTKKAVLSLQFDQISPSCSGAIR